MKPIKRLWPIPKNLKGYGAGYYKRVGKHLVSVEALTELDRESFLSLCGAYHLMQMSLDSVNADGLNVQGSQDDIKKNPALTTYKNASDIFHRLSKRFYLTPADRKGIELKKPKKANEKEKYFV